MPTTVNLKDLTQSDGPGAIVDKTNYNFQQLLALGVGAQGPVGPQGPQGPAGPTGVIGPQGVRGTRWYTYVDIDPSDPTLSPTDTQWVPPADLEIGDMYTDSLFNVWEYILNTTTNLGQWVNFINSNTLFSTFLISTGVTFKRTFQPSDGNSSEERFITFNQTAGADMASAGSSNANYYNDTLFLHNFDQTQVGNEFSGQNVLQFYNAMESIYVDHYNSSDDLSVRHHLQLGSVYKTTGGVRAIAKENNTLKIKYKVVTDANSNPLMYLSLFNASKNDSDPVTLGQFNSAFQFKVAKWDGTNHTTMWAAITSAQNIGQFTDTTFTSIDGIVFARAISKVGFGIEATGNRLALIGSTGTGAITGVYSNVPIDQFGNTINQTQFTADTLYLSGSNAKTIKADQGIELLTPNGISLVSDAIILSSDYNSTGADGLGVIYVDSTGRSSIGQSNITGVAGELMPTNHNAPTANVMVNGSFAAGMRTIIASSGTSAMQLRPQDMTVYVNANPSGATTFNLVSADATTYNRIVVIANNTTNNLSIINGSQTIGTLVAKNTAIYQSFGGTWVLILAAPNTLPTSGGTGTIYVSMSLTNIRTQPISSLLANGSRMIADLAFSFWSDQHGTIALPVGNIEVRVQHNSTVLDTNVSPTPVTQPVQPMFATTSAGGSPQILFPGVETVYNYYYRKTPFDFTEYQYVRNSTYVLADVNSPSGTNTQQDGVTPLVYTKVS